MKTVKRVGAVFLALLAGVCVPLLVWWVNIAGFWQLFAEWQGTRAQFRKLVCATNADCPPGHACISGRCLPQPSQ